jgi:thymidylate synthase (FAD)
MSGPLEDSISSVSLVDYMGSDLTVVNAARVSLDKFHISFQDNDTKLLKYMAEHGHWTPFAHPQLSFRIKMPIFVAREWFRHTVGLTRNEVSRRYVDTAPEIYFPKKWRKRAEKKVKQGSSSETTEWGIAYMLEHLEVSLHFYQDLLENDVAPEMARMILPQSMYTEFIETGSLYAYARICKLRIAPDAQQETRKYAEAVFEHIQPLFPNSWEALNG